MMLTVFSRKSVKCKSVKSTKPDAEILKICFKNLNVSGSIKLAHYQRVKKTNATLSITKK